MNEIDEKIEGFRKILVENGNPIKKEYQEKFLENRVRFLGIDLPRLQELVELWNQRNDFKELSTEERLDLVIKMMKGKFYEDKIAGGLFIQLFVMEKNNHKKILNTMETIYNHKLISDWDTGDWLSTRVLTPIIESGEPDLAARVSHWRNSDYIWKARASAVTFIWVKNLNNYSREIKDIVSALIKRKDLHAKTAASWLLREFSRSNKDYVVKFVSDNINFFNKGTILNALKYHPQEQSKYFL
jgi:3-methyladenine DNA glycosylase AlkD